MTDRRVPALAALAAALVAGSALAAPAVQMSGSFYVDGAVVPDEAARARQYRGITPDGSIRLGVDVDDDLTFSAKACIGCHGIEMEHAALDYQPRPWFNVQFGRLAVPFGELSNRLDPSSHKTATKPLIYDMGRMAFGERASFNSGVLMLPYVDTGVLVYGQKWIGGVIQAWYGAYAVAGLKGSNDVDWMALRSNPWVDNNHLPAYGGRLALTYSGDAGAFIGDLSIGGSYTGGRYDRDGKLQYEVVGADAQLLLWKFRLRGEWAMRRTHIDATASGYQYQVIDPWFDKDGFYAELEHPLGPWLEVVYRYDELRRLGVPLPGASAALTPDSRIVRYSGGLVITPATSLFVKLSYEHWEPSDFPPFDVGHVGLGGAF